MNKANAELIDTLSDEVIISIKNKLEKSPLISQTKIVGQPRVLVDFPEYQKVKGLVKILNEVEAKVGNFPEIQKIKGIVKALVDFPEVQKIEGNVEAHVNFPELQKIQGSVEVDFPEVQKIEGNVNTGLPTVKIGNQEIIPVMFFDGKRFVDPISIQIQGQGKMVSAIQQLATQNDGYTPTAYSGISNTVTSLKSSEGKFGGYYYTNPNSSIVYLQLFLDRDTVTLGTTAPDAIYGIPATGAANVNIGKDLPFTKSLKIAATTQPNGAAAPTTPLPITIYTK